MAVSEQIQELETRYQSLIAAEARAKANVERAEADLGAATKELAGMGFESVQAAQEWLAGAAQAVQAQVDEISQMLADAGA